MIIKKQKIISYVTSLMIIPYSSHSRFLYLRMVEYPRRKALATQSVTVGCILQGIFFVGCRSNDESQALRAASV
jgi:hypothetical protein